MPILVRRRIPRIRLTTVTGTASNTANGAASVAVTYTIKSANVTLLAVVTASDPAISISDSAGNTWSRIVEYSNYTSIFEMVYYATTTKAAGSTTVTVAGPASGYYSIGLVELNRPVTVDLMSHNDVTTSQTNAALSVPATQGDITIATLSTINNSTPAPAAPAIQATSSSGSQTDVDVTTVTAASNAAILSWTMATSQKYVALGASFKPLINPSVTASLVQQNTSMQTPAVSSGTVTLPSVTAGHALVLTVSNFNSSGTTYVTSVTDNVGNTWGRAVAQVTPSGGSYPTAEIWYCPNSFVSAGTLTASFTMNGTADYATNLSEWSNAFMVNAVNKSSNSGTTTPGSISVSSKVNDVVIATISNYGNDNPAVQSPATQMTATTNSGVNNDPGYLIATTTSSSIGWAAFTSSESMVDAIVSFTPYTGGRLAQSVSTLALVRQNTVINTSGVNSITITLPSVNAGDGLVITSVSSNATSSQVVSITDTSSNTWVRATGSYNYVETAIWYVQSAAASSGTLTVTLTSTSGQSPKMAINITEWNSGLTIDGAGTQFSTSTALQASQSVYSASGDLVIACMTTGPDDTPAPISPAVQLTTAASAGNISIDSAFMIANGGSSSISYKPWGTAEQWWMNMASFTPSVIVATPPTGYTYRWRGADVAAQTNGAAVTSIATQTGSITWSQATAANQPTWLTSGQGGRQAVRFDGSASYLAATAGTAISQPYTVVMVMALQNITGTREFMYQSSPSFDLVMNDNVTPSWAIDANGTEVTAGSPSLGMHLVAGAYNGASSQLYLDSASLPIGTGNIGASAFTPNGNVLGRHTTAGRYAQYDLYEVLVYPSALTAAQQTSLDAYYKSYYAVTPASQSLVQSASSQSTSTTATRTVALTNVVAGHALVLGVSTYSTDPVTGVTDSAGNTWTKALARDNDNNGDQEIWYCKSSAAAATLTVTVALTNTNSVSCVAMLAEFSRSVSGVRNTNYADSGSTAVASQTVSVTTVAGDLVFGLQSRGDNSSATGNAPSTPQSSIVGNSATNCGGFIGYQQATGTSTTASWGSTASTQLASLAVAFTP